MAMKRFLFLSVIILVVAFAAFADTIILKSGQTVEGTILERNNDSIKVDVEGVTLNYYLEEIAKINQEVVAPQVTQANEVDASKEQNTQEQSGDDFSNVERGDQSSTRDETLGTSRQDYDSEETLRRLPGSSAYSKMGAATLATMGIAVIIFILFLAVLVYVYSSLCLFFIAKKTAEEPAWLAWVPIGNLFLMCKIGKLSYLWLLPLLVPFVAMPVVFLFGAITGAAQAAITGGFSVIILVMQILSSLAMAALFAFIWYKIALARNKPGWIGIVIGGSIILNLIPFVGILGSLVYLVLMGYLAFSQ